MQAHRTGLPELKSCGPGVMPNMTRAVIKMAVVALPGTPKAIIGTIAPPVEAFLAASATATPSMAPSPN